jgi:putative Mn2+ efflux pump MntP
VHLVTATLGVMVGRGLGALAGQRAELVGGLVLIGIGAGTLVQHLGAAGAGI